MTDMFTQIREAIGAQSNAGYEAGKYVKGADNAEKKADAYREATKQVTEMWTTLYQMASEVSAALPCICPDNCPDENSGMPCNNCHAARFVRSHPSY